MEYALEVMLASNGGSKLMEFEVLGLQLYIF